MVQVAVQIAQGNTKAAVKTLNAYLSEFAADGEAWLQLAKLHVDALNYEVPAPPSPHAFVEYSSGAVLFVFADDSHLLCGARARSTSNFSCDSQK